ncbi:PAS domain S-box protein [Bradyrhizobium japonicum]|uniref:PAS domain S-box protein n=1 Tax=Bradyrhizobium japonicum TaxID=375 RepID=UPI0009B61B45
MSGFAKAKCALGRLPLREDGLRLVLETSLDAVIVMKLNSVVVEWNSRATEIFGWSREEAGRTESCGFHHPRAISRSTHKRNSTLSRKRQE